MPVVPFIPAIIGAAGSIGSSLINKSAAGGGGTVSNNANFQQFGNLLNTLGEKGDQLTHFGKQERHAFRQTLDPARDYWRDLLQTNDPTKMASLFAPELNQINRQTQSAVRTMGEFGPRGGGTNSAINALQNQQARQVSDLFTRAKPLAAQNLTQIAPLYSGLAASEQGAGVGATSAASNQALTNALGQMWADIERRKQTLGAAGGLGSALGSLFGSLFNRNTTGGGGVSPGLGTLPGLGGVPSPNANPYGGLGN